jgi:hypothetical protein
MDLSFPVCKNYGFETIDTTVSSYDLSMNIKAESNPFLLLQKES